jgi:hypothetical protein
MNNQTEIESLKARLAQLENAPLAEYAEGYGPPCNELQTVVGGPWGLDSQGRTTLNGTRIVGPLNQYGFTATLHYPDDIGSRWKAPGSSQATDAEAPGEAAAGFHRSVKRPGPKGRKVLILAIDPSYDGILKLDEDSDFESAAEAATLLDVSPSAISQAIHKAAGKPWTVKGVTMQYEDLYIADDSNFSKND